MGIKLHKYKKGSTALVVMQHMIAFFQLFRLFTFRKEIQSHGAKNISPAYHVLEAKQP